MLIHKYATIGIRTALWALLPAALAIATGVGSRKSKTSRYRPHQGKREMTRRRRAMCGV